MRVRIVIHDAARGLRGGGIQQWERPSAPDLIETGARAWEFGLRVLCMLARRTRQALCGLTGHDDVRRLERTKISLRCQRCGRTTPGWRLGGMHRE